MNGSLKILAKDLREMSLGPRALVAYLLLPCLVLLLVGQLHSQPERLTLLAANTGECAEPEDGYSGSRCCTAQDDVGAQLRILKELSNVSLSCQADYEVAPLARLVNDGFDMVLNYSGDGDAWGIYIAETDSRRLPKLLELAYGLRLTTVGVSGSDIRDDDSAGVQVFRVGALGGFPMQAAHVYYPQAFERSLAMLTQTVALIACFLPFLVAAPSLLREREAHTLEILLSAPGAGATSIFVGKCLLAVAVTMTSLFAMLLLLQGVYDLYIKDGIAAFVTFLLLPVLASTFLGLTVSALSSSQAHSVVSAAIYFLLLVLFGGFLRTPATGSTLIQLLSSTLPLTYTTGPVQSWMFGAGLAPALDENLLPLALLTASFGIVAAFGWRYRLRRI